MSGRNERSSIETTNTQRMRSIDAKFWMLLLVALHVLPIQPSFGQVSTRKVEGIVAAAVDDPYRTLAEEISSEAGYALVDSPLAALEADPEFLIWVLSPSCATDADFVDYGREVETLGSTVSLGIITGGTLEKARALWQRRSEARGERVAAINGLSPPASIFAGQIITWPSGERTVGELTLESLRRTLENSDYVTFTGHGTPWSWVLDDSTKLRADDLPPLPPLVVSTANCNTLRFWENGSIAMAFVDQGAAAYAGFLYSPNAGYLLGAFEGLPLRFTWPEFPVGRAAQVLNRGCRQGFAAFPYYYLIGDPRMALADRPPYEIVGDDEADGVRRIKGRDAPAGTLAVRVEDGARYEYVQVAGVTSASSGDLLFNSRLQMADIGRNKYLLFLQHGGDFAIEFRRKAPAWWALADPVLDSLDHNLICLSRRGGDVLQLVGGMIAFLCAAWFYRKGHRDAWVAALLTGVLFAAFLWTYATLRGPVVTANSKPVLFSELAVPGFFLLSASGCLIYLVAHSWWRRALGLAIACSYPWCVAIATAAMLFEIRRKTAARLGAPIWNYQLVLPDVIAFLVLAPSMLIWFEVLRRGLERQDARTGLPAHCSSALSTGIGDSAL